VSADARERGAELAHLQRIRGSQPPLKCQMQFYHEDTKKNKQIKSGKSGECDKVFDNSPWNNPNSIIRTKVPTVKRVWFEFSNLFGERFLRSGM
jgi:hypothetical protein